MTKHYKDI